MHETPRPTGEAAEFSQELNTMVENVLDRKFPRRKGSYRLNGPDGLTGWLNYGGKSISTLDISLEQAGLIGERILKQAHIIRSEDGTYKAHLSKATIFSGHPKIDGEPAIGVEHRYSGILDEESYKVARALLKNKELSVYRIREEVQPWVRKHTPRPLKKLLYRDFEDTKKPKGFPNLAKARKASAFVVHTLGLISPHSVHFMVGRKEH